MKYNLSLLIVILFLSTGFAQKNVGIGIDVPSSRLHLHQGDPFSDPTSKIQLSNFHGGPGVSDGLILSAILNDASLINRENGYLHLGTNNINRISILGNGTIGINTTAVLGSSDLTLKSLNPSSYGGMYIESPDENDGRPFYGYATNGYSTMWHYFDANTQSWRVYNNGDRFTIDSNGKIGIGNLSPAQMLSVNGKIELGDDLTTATEGAIRWSGSDFEGYNGSEYESFTYYLERDDLLGYSESYNLDFCDNPDTITIYTPDFLYPDVEDCGILYDTGGPDSGYGNNEDFVYIVYGTYDTFISGTTDYKKVIVEEVDIEPLKDSLIIFCNNQSYVYSGLSTIPDTFLCNGKFLKVKFKSDSSNPQAYSGFKIRFEFNNLDTLEQMQNMGYYFNPGNKSLAAGLNFNDTWKDSLGTNSLSFGTYSEASGESSIAIGEATEATMKGSTALGKYARANCEDCCAIGYNAYNNTEDAIVLGNSSVVNIGGYQNWSNLSDGRFKLDIKEDIPGLEFITKLRPISYKFDINKFNEFQGQEREETPRDQIASNELRTGFIAQEVESLAQSIGYDFSGVFSPKDEYDHYSLRYAEFVVPLVKAVQELSDENTNLKDQVNSFKAELLALKSMVQNLESKL